MRDELGSLASASTWQVALAAGPIHPRYLGTEIDIDERVRRAGDAGMWLVIGPPNEVGLP